MDVGEAWQLQRRWSVVATKTADDLNRWRSINLGLIVLGALLGALAAQSQWFPPTMTLVLGAAGAAALAVAGIIQARLLTADRIRARVVTRAGSEALKGIVYQYLAGVEPFASKNRNANLAEKVGEVERLAADHASLVAGAAPDARAVPQVNGVADYVEKRAEDQRSWHEQRTAKHKALARYWRTAELIATGAAAFLAAVGGVWHAANLSAWVAVATTAGAAFAAHLASQQHDRIADTYAQTVLSLNDAIRRFDAESATKDEAAAFVANVEQVLAAQNDAWVGLFSARSSA
jgi:SMODS and SLOG-associating 2TM effector domain 1/Protein of unknown function (DUF4231)